MLYHLDSPEIKVTDFFISQYLICRWIKLILCMLVDIGQKFYAVPLQPT